MSQQSSPHFPKAAAARQDRLETPPDGRRFVLLRHETPEDAATPLHWDLMIEDGPFLATWRLLRLVAGDDVQVVERIADHRREYLDYEGPISGGRGRVHRVDAGHLTATKWGAAEVVGTIEGRVIRGTIQLQLQTSEQWLLQVRNPSRDG